MKEEKLTLLTDLYQLTMASAYYRKKHTRQATFSLFIRKYPEGRNYFVSAGLEDALEFARAFGFEQDEVEYLSTLGLFDDDFLHYLRTLRFTGDIVAIPEGRLFFENEPVLEVTAPIIEAQLLETFLINTINLQTMIATKASRCYQAAEGRKLVDFSLRRTQGSDAGLKVARSSYLAGFGGTSNVLAGRRYGIPVSGTMAHSFVTSFEDEIEAFRAFADTFPENTVLLIDTYDTLEGARKAAVVGREMKERGQSMKGVRLDSGDMADLSREVRQILDEEGLEDVKIFSSGSFDEYKITGNIARGTETDAYGVGTKMGVSSDAPYNDIAYKLVKYDGRPVLKLSTGKRTLVDQKQVFRFRNSSGPSHDVIALRDEELPGEALLLPVMKDGERLGRSEPLDDIRDRFLREFSSLDQRFRRIEEPEQYPVRLSEGLSSLQKRVVQQVKEKELGES